ncbi:hypothetical protein FRX31_032476, partial [Thalictrum thalictroides]
MSVENEVHSQDMDIEEVHPNGMNVDDVHIKPTKNDATTTDGIKFARNLKFEVWKHFKQVEDSNPPQALCNY